jgi:hypothetical protein
MAPSEPVHDAAHDREHAIGLSGAVIILDVIEEGGDVATAETEEVPILLRRHDVAS